VQRNWLRLLRCSGAGESLRGCESGGDGEEEEEGGEESATAA